MIPIAKDPMKMRRKEAQDITKVVTGEAPVDLLALIIVWYMTIVTASLNILSPKI
jgi:hypothetical protein